MEVAPWASETAWAAVATASWSVRTAVAMAAPAARKERPRAPYVAGPRTRGSSDAERRSMRSQLHLWLEAIVTLGLLLASFGLYGFIFVSLTS
jgi:hypothetical protein